MLIDLPVSPLTRGVSFALGLADFGDAAAVVTAGGRLSYRELAARVDDLARRLGTGRRLVLLAPRNDLDSLVGYLACLAAGHPVLLVPADHDGAVAALTAAYDPDVVLRGGLLDERRDGSAHELHPDLALLLSTSGSTGSPKLVRLSHTNLQANAESIAQYLDIQPTDRAATTLPMSYCYGVSVINSHLLRGASLLLTDLSVVDGCFWDLFRAERGTTFAGVPHTFALLDRVGFADMDLPHLRYVTQAGGRLAPDRVRHFAELGRRRGWDLVVMYGQTEATARMAYLPPDLATSHPGAIGVPVPGGSFSLRPVEGRADLAPGVGELVYAGPNVMLGYARTPADLALGRVVDVLPTGDLARRTPDGLYEVVGRRSRFAKVFGLRIDLQRVEEILEQRGVVSCCAGDDDQLVIAIEGEHDPATVRTAVAVELGIPAGALEVVPVDSIPRRANGKPDYAAVRRLAEEGAPPRTAPAAGDAASVRALYAELLDVPEVGDDDTFVGLGGDSLSYVEVSIRLEDLLGTLPSGWHVTPVRDLAHAAAPTRPRPGRSVETGVLLRALAIVLIVSTHAGLLDLKGTAHVLIAVAGFNFARFQLTALPRRQRVRNQLVAVARVAVPSMVWIAAAYLLTDRYGLVNIVLLNAVFGPATWSPQWDFWFVEVLVLVLLALAVLLAMPWLDRWERRFPFAFVAVLVAVGLLWRYDLGGVDLLHTKPVFWLFALGWAAARARTHVHRLAVTAVVLLTVPGFFDDWQRDAVIAAGVVLLVWVPTLRAPRVLGRVAAVLASASLYIYLTHWQVYPHLDGVSPLLAVVASLAVGVAYGRLVTHVTGWWSRAWRRLGRLPGAHLTNSFRYEAGGGSVARMPRP